MLQRAACSLALSIFTTATIAGAQPNYHGEALPSGAETSAPGVDPAQSTATTPSSQPPTAQPAPQLAAQGTAPAQPASNPYYASGTASTAYSTNANAGGTVNIYGNTMRLSAASASAVTPAPATRNDRHECASESMLGTYHGIVS